MNFIAAALLICLYPLNDKISTIKGKILIKEIQYNLKIYYLTNIIVFNKNKMTTASLI